MERPSDISQKLYTYKEEHPDTQWYLGWCLSDTHQYVQTRVSFDTSDIKLNSDEEESNNVFISFVDKSSGVYLFKPEAYPFDNSEEVILPVYLLGEPDYSFAYLLTDPNWATGKNKYQMSRQAENKIGELVNIFLDLNSDKQSEVLTKLSILHADVLK